jgi:uncharacterized protein (DUF2384 family)
VAVTCTDPTLSPHPSRAGNIVHGGDRAAIDARVLDLFDNPSLRSRLRKLDEVELSSVWRLTLHALSRQAERNLEPVSLLMVHRRMLEGLAGEALLVSSAMFLSEPADAAEYFGLSFKTIKARRGASLDSAASELAMRAARATMTVAGVLGGYDAARDYMRTRNFALGGFTPANLVKTSDGECIVLNELYAQAEGGPL